MAENQKVRLVSNPGRVGFLTGRTRERGNRTLYQISFPEGKQYVPEGQYELIQDSRENPLDLLEDGKIGYKNDLRRTLTQVRLGGRLTDLLYSMEITNTDFYAYQFKPVLKLLNSPLNGLLIADEVGLGKTIEAGLIWTELQSRFDLRRLLVMCPAMLREKWVSELSYRFGISADICDADKTLTKLEEGRSVGTSSSFKIVASMQGVRPNRGWRRDDKNSKRATTQLAKFLLDNEEEPPMIDLLIIDEAHYLRNPESKTAEIGRLLRKVSEYVITLSATPIHLKSEDLFQLMNLIDEDTFNHIYAFDQIIRANKPLIAARDAILTKNIDHQTFIDLLNEAKNNRLLSGNRQLNHLIEYSHKIVNFNDVDVKSNTARKLENLNLLSNVITRTRKRDVTEWRVIREPVAEEVELTSIEEQFYQSVTNTVREFCQDFDYHEGFLLVTPQRQMASSMSAALMEWKRKNLQLNEQVYEDIGYDSESFSAKPLIGELISKVDDFGDPDALFNIDSKYKRFLSVLKQIFENNPSEKVVLFSYFRPTLSYLKKRLKADGIKSSLLMGGGRRSKEEILQEFRDSKDIRVLLSSEVGSEGIDLQFCRMLINYDLPWNPMKVEQRIGRIDRLGQNSEKIIIWNLFYANTIDSRIYRRLYARLDLFKDTLGDIEPVLGDEIRKLSYDLLKQKLTMEQEENRIHQTAIALQNKRNHERELENEAAHLVAHGDYILKQVKAARDLNRWISSKDIESYVIDFLSIYYPGCTFKRVNNSELIYEIALSNEAKLKVEEFIRSNHLDNLTILIRNDPRPVRCKFENKVVSKINERSETINQIHPLVRFINDELTHKDDLQQHPAVAVKLPATSLSIEIEKGYYVFTVQKWSVTGLQEIEKLSYAIAKISDPPELMESLDSERIVVDIITSGEDWYDAQRFINLKRAAKIANEYCLSQLDNLYEEFIGGIERENYDRVEIQLKNLDSHMNNQLNKLNRIREGHELSGRQSLVKATEGKIEKLKNRVDRRRLYIKAKKEIKSNSEDINMGILHIY